ncbi:hypothetical protein [Actinokineospora sp.]|uniref:hypothetical protein n=1 Tax=Actinokineospora sp. TaxID=1872133 RepID=UPI004037F826
MNLAEIGHSRAAQLHVLRRASQDRLHLDRPNGDYFDRGRLLAAHLHTTVPLLLELRHLEVVQLEHGNGWGSLRLTLTERGRARLASLTEQAAGDLASSRAATSSCHMVELSLSRSSVMWIQYAASAVVALWVVTRVVANLFERPSNTSENPTTGRRAVR